MIGITDPTHLDLIREAVRRGASSVTTEFFCLEARADLRVKKRYVEMSKVCGYDLYPFYRKHTRGSGYWRLNYEVKREFVEEMQALCKELHIPFFVSDAHHKEKCAHGNCCGCPQDKYFSNYQKCQFTEAIVIAKKNGKVHFSDISKNFHKFFDKTKVRPVLHSGDMATSFYKSLYDYMRWCWNHPKKCGSSPYRYFDKMLIPKGLDENGDVIYEFNQAKYDYK